MNCLLRKHEAASPEIHACTRILGKVSRELLVTVDLELDERVRSATWHISHSPV